jgi:hypothetical protein
MIGLRSRGSGSTAVFHGFGGRVGYTDKRVIYLTAKLIHPEGRICFYTHLNIYIPRFLHPPTIVQKPFVPLNLGKTLVCYA